MGEKQGTVWENKNPSKGETSAKRRIRGTLTHCPPRMAHELMYSNEVALEMEPKMKEIFDIQRCDEHTIVQHFVMHSIMFMTAREGKSGLLVCRKPYEYMKV